MTDEDFDAVIDALHAPPLITEVDDLIRKASRRDRLPRAEDLLQAVEEELREARAWGRL